MKTNIMQAIKQIKDMNCFHTLIGLGAKTGGTFSRVPFVMISLRQPRVSDCVFSGKEVKGPNAVAKEDQGWASDQ